MCTSVYDESPAGTSPTTVLACFRQKFMNCKVEKMGQPSVSPDRRPRIVLGKH